MNKSRLCQQLILHEDLRTVAYHDNAPEANVTIGVGYNVTARGWDFLERVLQRKMRVDDRGVLRITEVEALQVLSADVDRVEAAVRASFPFYAQLDDVRQRVCCDLAFNVGYSALGFKNTIDAVEHRNWSRAAIEMHKSKWATQVHGRADRLAHMMLTGEDYL